MKILNASAGSGKTYRLSHKYIDLLLSSDDRWAYRHILAVTFTNKATAEMKGRILKDLAEEAKTNKKAKRILTDMLHDYSAFAVSTIDKFFQQVLRAFSRETGHFGTYQVELDKPSLVKEAMDRILDSITEENKDLIEWIGRSAGEQIEQGRHFNIEEGLYEMGNRLKNDEHRVLAEKYGITGSFSKEQLETIRTSCRKLIKDFEDGAAGFGIEVKRGEKIKNPGVRMRNRIPGLGEYFDECYGTYLTARTLDSLIDNLGLAGEFYKEFDALLKEKNVLPLDDSNAILRDIIDGSDAPFVYEKMGVRFSDFLLDEFQDTSKVQWDNFLPLLQNSESAGGYNLVVGDVKQSIYRWRGSEWKLLGEEVQRQFPGADLEPMRDNWRSACNIVRFNSDFFRFAAGKLGEEAIYAGVAQNVKSKDSQKGCVRIEFTDGQTEAVINSVAGAIANGAAQSDIAILVRTGEEGGLLAAALLENGYDVISDDSLTVKSSFIIRRLTALLHSFDNPEDSTNAFVASSLGIEFPSTFHSLYDLCEGFLREMQEKMPDRFDGEALFIDAFMDDLQDWCERYGNNIRAFLAHWDESDLKISSPEGSDAVRIMTIHKSKGLEFPHVIFPFAEKVKMYKAEPHWCHLDPGRSGITPQASGIYPVSLTKDSGESLFRDDYENECRMQAIDNLNIFYVAMTRAVCTLHVIAGLPPKKLSECKNIDTFSEWSDLSELLFVFCKGSYFHRVGEDYDYSRMPREKKAPGRAVTTGFVSYDIDGRLKASDKASDFFGENGTAGAESSGRLYGIALHDILAGVNTASDLRAAVDNARISGSLDSGTADEALALLTSRLKAHAEWFGPGTRNLNETAIIDTDGNEQRPDRVVAYPDGRIVIIDYKFGDEKKSHLKQVAGYAELYRRMGFRDVSGFVWYVRPDKVVPI